MFTYLINLPSTVKLTERAEDLDLERLLSDLGGDRLTLLLS